MRAAFRLLLFTVLAATATARPQPTPPALANAQAVRSMLGPQIWARLLQIDNSGPRSFWSVRMYPRTVYAVVFELAGILWFYSDANGTQSLSQELGTLERDEADPGPLLRSIDPGFASWVWVDESGLARPVGPQLPPNACFPASVAALFRRIVSGGAAPAPQLLSYYVNIRGGRLGHTVLLFGLVGNLSAIDAETSDRPVGIPAYLGGDLRAIAEFLRGGPVASARALPIPCERRPKPPRWAADAAPGGKVG